MMNKQVRKPIELSCERVSDLHVTKSLMEMIGRIYDDCMRFEELGVMNPRLTRQSAYIRPDDT